MKQHDPYTEPDWQGDEASRRAGRPLFRCPDCSSDADFGPKAHKRTDGSERHYRACKNCGFWQEADGSPPYRVWLAQHDCVLVLRPGQLNAECPTCGNRWTVTQETHHIPHTCAKYLTPWEPGFQCTNCGQFIDDQHKKPLSSSGSDDSEAT